MFGHHGLPWKIVWIRSITVDEAQYILRHILIRVSWAGILGFKNFVNPERDNGRFQRLDLKPYCHETGYQI